MNLREIIEGEAPLSADEIGMYLPSEPYGKVLIIADELEDESRELLEQLSTQWDSLWPKLRSELEEGLADHSRSGQRLEEGAFSASIRPLYEEDTDFGADCELVITFDVGGPQWDCSLRDGTIVHFQPVF
ncbi:hypothetical protein HAHE_06790 [Haloferula helveola]|uniref:DUF2262 domain-containing protein n=1 Tax=Haloferula helveola TaxID=490095 RepID=A0ABM7RDC8_9BACT|nr:hypothetical protein HAHE_06790 [Haloferula helveola]